MLLLLNEGKSEHGYLEQVEQIARRLSVRITVKLLALFIYKQQQKMSRNESDEHLIFNLEREFKKKVDSHNNYCWGE